jgi:hypothetical protein
VRADSALKSDAFLRDAPSILARIMQTSLATGDSLRAQQICADGRNKYADRPEYWSCPLTILGWTANTPRDVERGWGMLQAIAERDSAHVLANGAPTRHLLVAAIAARAGLRDSALAITQRVRAELRSGASTASVDYGEAYVQTLLDRPELALPLLDRYLAAVPAQRAQVRTSPWFTKLHGNPTFVSLTAAR